MKKNISIEKTIDFSGMIGEITAISLEHNLKFVSDDEINGDLIVCGRYKSTVASQIEEEFNEKIPVSISLLERIDVSSANVDISNFYYNIVDNASLKCNIDLLVDALEIIDDDERGECSSLEERECDGDPISEKEIEIPKIDKSINNNQNEDAVLEDIEKDTERNEDNININVNNNSNVVVSQENIDVEKINEEVENVNENDNLFFNFDNSKESYGTFVVYMVRQNETINSILEKYNTSIEEIEKYNDIKDISIGSKLIIPLLNEEN